MRTLARAGVAAAAALALGGVLLMGGRGAAGDDDGKAHREAVDKIADAYEKGKGDEAAKLAEALAKKHEDVHEIMDLFKKRKKGEFGVGDKPGAIIPDGIELKLLALGRDAPTAAQAEKEAAALKRMALRTAAIVEFALAKGPPHADKGGATKKLWEDSAKASRDAALELAKAADEKAPASLKAAATKVNNACNNCHSEWR
jgi:cytochrome c556